MVLDLFPTNPILNQRWWFDSNEQGSKTAGSFSNMLDRREVAEQFWLLHTLYVDGTLIPNDDVHVTAEGGMAPFMLVVVQLRHKNTESSRTM